jgi:hypothetical protein
VLLLLLLLQGPVRFGAGIVIKGDVSQQQPFPSSLAEASSLLLALCCCCRVLCALALAL